MKTSIDQESPKVIASILWQHLLSIGTLETGVSADILRNSQVKFVLDQNSVQVQYYFQVISFWKFAISLLDQTKQVS